MKAIVNVDREWGIGKDGHLLVHIPADMKMFRAETTGKIVVYGRKTLETFPGGKPLKNRVNIILSRNPAYTVEGAYVVHDPEELMKLIETEFPEYGREDVCVIGGDSIYRLLLPYCSAAVVTRTEASFDADAWFPNLDEDPAWTCVVVGETQEFEGIRFHFDRYERVG